MSSPFPFLVCRKFAGISLSMIALFAAMLPITAHADDKPPLPDQKDILPQLQKIGGKDWTVTTTPDGFLMTYAQPVVLHDANARISKADLGAQLTKGKTDKFSVKIIIGRPLTAAELARPNNPYSERPDLPMDPTAVKALNQSHYFICSPTSWATDPKYTVYIASYESSDQAIFPEKASDAYDQVLSDLGTFFHF